MSKGKGSAAVKHDDDRVEGVDVTKVKLSIVVKALDDAEIDSKEMTASEKVSALQLYNRKHVARNKLAQCVECGGLGDKDLPSCQFCGDEGLEGEGEEEGNKEEENESEDSDVGEAAESHGVRGEKTGKVVSLAKVKGKSEELSKFDENSLDEATARILDLKQRGSKVFWEMGREIGIVYDNQIWKFRMNGKKGAYTGFTQYAEKELKISKTSAFSMMDTAKKFSETQINKFGGTKLSLLLTAPTKDQPEIMQEIEKGASAKQVREKIKQTRKKAKLNKRQTKVKAPKGKVHRSSTGRMTVAMVDGKKTLSMFAKPEKKLAEGEKLEKHAMKVNDIPFAIEEMDNGVVRFYTVTLGPKGLKLEIETKRAE